MSTTTRNRSGLTALADGARVFLESVGVSVPAVGAKYRSFQVNQGPGGAQRVVFIPGEFDGSTAPKLVNGGAFAQPRNVRDYNPRALLRVDPVVTLSLWAVDLTAPTDEQAQRDATWNLLELAVQACHNAKDPVTGRQVGLANLKFQSFKWNQLNVDEGFGLEMFVYLTQGEPLFDQPQDMAYPTPVIDRDPAS